MYWNERDHPVAHFHAYHAGHRASVSADRVVLAGSLESRALGFVQEWARLRHDEIVANWERPGRTSHCSPYGRCLKIEDVDENYLPVLVGAAVVGDWVLRLLFSDGTVGDIDFSSESWTGVLEPLNDPAYFAQVEVNPEAGTVVWPGGIDLAPEPLYEQAKAHPLAAA
jgi:Protein of unknown function (DUF2442)/Domain of unknown function (DUF4160)